MPRHEIKKHGSETVLIFVEKNEYQGRTGVDIREHIKNPDATKYSGPTKSGLKIPKENWKDFKKAVDEIGKEMQ